MRMRGSLIYIAMLMIVGGCGGLRQDVAWVQRRPLGGSIQTYVPPVNPPARGSEMAAFEEPGGIIDLPTAWSAALMANPELRAFSWEVRAGEARALQASLPPNPEIDLEIEELRTSRGSGEAEERPGSGFGNAEYVISISQVIELAGKREKRTRVATLERDLAAWDYETKRVDVLTDVTKTFVEVLAAQERVALAGKLVGLSEKSLTTVRQRVKAGKESPLEETKAKVALATSRIQADQSVRSLKAARQRLAATWAGSSSGFEKVKAAFDLVKPIPSLDELADLISQNPDVARWATEMERRQAEVELARANGMVDLTVGGGIQHFAESNDTAIVLGFSLPLPLFDRNQGGIREADFLRAKAEEERRATEIAVRTALTESYQALASSLSLVTGLRDGVLPGAKKAFEAAGEGYRMGKFRYLDVLDAQRTYFEAQGQFIDALEAYHQAIVDVERLIGERLDAINNTPE